MWGLQCRETAVTQHYCNSFQAQSGGSMEALFTFQSITKVCAAGKDDALSASGLRFVPQAPGGRPSHRLHQAQAAGDPTSRLQRGAGAGTQVSHTL